MLFRRKGTAFSKTNLDWPVNRRYSPPAVAEEKHRSCPAAPAGSAEQSGTYPFELRTWRSPDGLALLLLAALTLAMFADVLLLGQGRVLSASGNNLFHYFVHWRDFGFQELRAGHLALWNPHYYSGTPFFGGFQSALLYPLNVLFLVLPLGAAINWSIALHVWLAGTFTYLWARNRGLHPLAAFLSASMFMFAGPYFLHIFAGHLPNLCTMVWAPLLFLAIDKVFVCPSLGPCLLAILASAMALLAGHIQYVFYLAVAAGVYSVLNLARSGRGGAFSRTQVTPEIGAREDVRLPGAALATAPKVILCLGLICLGAVGLTAVQLFTGLQEAGESLRGGGVRYDFASAFSFPP